MAKPDYFNTVINLPGGKFRKGVDLSHHNKNVDWRAIVAAGVNFVYLKATESANITDLTAGIRANNARAFNIDYGYYHFAHPAADDAGDVAAAARAEANFANHTLNNLPKATLPVALDLECTCDLSQHDFLLWVTTFIATCQYSVIIYSTDEYLDTHLPAGHGLGQYPLWLARYSNDYKKAQCPAGWTNWKMWQFSASGQIGVSNPIDLDLMST